MYGKPGIATIYTLLNNINTTVAFPAKSLRGILHSGHLLVSLSNSSSPAFLILKISPAVRKAAGNLFPFCGVSLHYADYLLCSAKTLQFHVIPFVAYWCYPLSYWSSGQESFLVHMASVVPLWSFSSFKFWPSWTRHDQKAQGTLI